MSFDISSAAILRSIKGGAPRPAFLSNSVIQDIQDNGHTVDEFLETMYNDNAQNEQHDLLDDPRAYATDSQVAELLEPDDFQHPDDLLNDPRAYATDSQMVELLNDPTPNFFTTDLSPPNNHDYNPEFNQQYEDAMRHIGINVLAQAKLNVDNDTNLTPNQRIDELQRLYQLDQKIYRMAENRHKTTQDYRELQDYVNTFYLGTNPDLDGNTYLKNAINDAYDPLHNPLAQRHSLQELHKTLRPTRGVRFEEPRTPRTARGISIREPRSARQTRAEPSQSTRTRSTRAEPRAELLHTTRTSSTRAEPSQSTRTMSTRAEPRVELLHTTRTSSTRAEPSHSTRAEHPELVQQTIYKNAPANVPVKKIEPERPADIYLIEINDLQDRANFDNHQRLPDIPENSDQVDRDFTNIFTINDNSGNKGVIEFINIQSDDEKISGRNINIFSKDGKVYKENYETVLTYPKKIKEKKYLVNIRDLIKILKV